MVLVTFLGLWEAGVFHRILRVEAYTLAYPSGIAAAIVNRWDLLRDESLYTLVEVVGGYGLGAVGGIAAGLAAASLGRFGRALYSLMAASNSMPIIALAPVTVVYLGSGQASKVALVALMTIPPMVVLFYKGLTSVPSEYTQLMSTIAASKGDVFFKLRVPAALPYVFIALKLNVTLALIGAIVGEFFASEGGLGQLMTKSLQLFAMPVAWATISIAAAFGIAFYLLVRVIEAMAIPWHSSQR